ncbi:uncharacterized protein LOC126623989 [Malus sylvestris]|uniref:uncharacterized protein LOC126623989 n=1 Tax=Malus sylvestris TaxID=3752 RepID=UPI0021AD4548|nr:uncharacterized protein LOC126623989 [Malus sylvestris]
MTIFGRVLRTARTWRSSTPLRQTLILLRARSHLTFHFLLAVSATDIGISKPALCTIPGAVEGRKVSIKIQIPATRDAAQLIANIASDLGLIYVFLPYFSY